MRLGDVETRIANESDVDAIAAAHRDSIRRSGRRSIRPTSWPPGPRGSPVTSTDRRWRVGKCSSSPSSPLEGTTAVLGFATDYLIDGATHGTSAYVRGIGRAPGDWLTAPAPGGGARDRPRRVEHLDRIVARRGRVLPAARFRRRGPRRHAPAVGATHRGRGDAQGSVQATSAEVGRWIGCGAGGPREQSTEAGVSAIVGRRAPLWQNPAPRPAWKEGFDATRRLCQLCRRL